MKLLAGYKTYFIAGVGIIFNGLVAMGYVDEHYRDAVNSLLAFLGLGTIRAAVKKVE